jgi:hypothetical protein
MTLLDQLTIPQLRLALLMVDDPLNDNDIAARALRWLDGDEDDLASGEHPALSLLQWLALGTTYEHTWRDDLADLEDEHWEEGGP